MSEARASASRHPAAAALLALADWAYHGSAIVMLATMVVIAANALLRYLFHSGSSGVYDIARFSFLFIIFLGLTRTNSMGGHARVRLLMALLPRRAQYILLNRVVPVLSMAYMVALFVSGAAMTWAYAVAGSRTSGVIAIPLAPVTAVIPVTSALFVAVQVIHLVEKWAVREEDPDHDLSANPDMVVEPF